MSRPPHRLTPSSTTMAVTIACSALAFAVVPAGAAAQTHHAKDHRAKTHRSHRPAHSARNGQVHKHRVGGTSSGSTSPVNTPPVSTTPVSTSPVSTPPASTPPVTTAPAPTPPVTTPPSGSTDEPETETPLAAFPGGGRPFAASSPWNVAIPANPVLDPNNSAIAGYLGSEGKAYADLYESGNPVFESTAGTPTYNVTCTEPWGTCPLSSAPVAIPAGAEASSGSDGSMVVINWSTRTGYDFWRAQKTSSGWTAAWGTTFSIDGMGTEGGATGAGMPLLAGMIRTYEIERGYIDHALTFSTDNACQTVLRYPASKTDGSSSQPNCIPEGARVQLNPAIDVDAIPGITPAERMIAHALQTYGAYADNNGGAKMAFSFEDPVGRSNPYPAAGLPWDYYDMPQIPWNQLRILKSWNGS
jgi:hypothetical protein